MADEKEETFESAESPSAEPESSNQPVAPVEEAGCPIVGIGASTGGLEALEEFFEHLPPDSGIAFVIVTHQPLDRVSLLPELLRKRTVMPVQEVTAATKVEPNHVYLSSPGMHLALHSATLQPIQGDTRHGNLPFPVDYFFRSLADAQKDRAICVVLSGTGTDGTLGLQAVKGAGGLTMVQEEKSAKFAGMPGSAIATGLVDYVLPAAQLPRALLTFVQGPYLQGISAPAPSATLTPDLLQQIYLLLRNRTRHDFSVYKLSTIQRRIERRMNVHQFQDVGQYVRFLYEHPYELDLLFQELLIGVTGFFRDPEAFMFLEDTALPGLLAERPEQYPLRVWVPGCSTGEEAYSLAIVLRECLERIRKSCPVQIFATDLNHQAIEKARTGLYPENIAVDVGPERLERYFRKEETYYRVKKEIREMLVFAQQNLLMDPPFTRIDLISCRNVLIYLSPEVQRQLIPLFHYALNPGGLLLLGSSETISGFTDLFTPLDHRAKVFKRKESAPGLYVLPEFPAGAAKPAVGAVAPRTLPKPTETTLASLVEKLLIQRFALPSVIVNDRGDIIYIHGLTGRFLQPAPGPPSHNLFTMAREGLQTDLVAAVHQAATQEGIVVHKRVRVKANGGVVPVEVTVQKLANPEPLRGLLLVSFQTLAEKPARRAKKGQTPPVDQSRIEELEREIRTLRETLQSTVEETNSANEELKSANEELQSTNEELQSSNEELQTAKEEMQSLNEELQTVNAELQGKLEALSRTNDDMQNLLNSTNVVTLFLDNGLCIKRFTPQAKQIFRLIQSDVGRPIGDLVSNLRYDRLPADAQEVLQTLIFKELEVSTEAGGWYAMRIMPYRTSDNIIDGLVITFVNITRQKQAEQASAAAQAYAESIAETIREPLVVLDEQLQVVLANRPFYRTFQILPQEAAGQRFYELNGGLRSDAALRTQLEDILMSQSTFEDFAMDLTFPRVGRKILRLNARRIERAAGLPVLILLVMEDVTEREQQT